MKQWAPTKLRMEVLDDMKLGKVVKKPASLSDETWW